MGFAVPRCLRFERWSLTPPFHPYRSSCEPRRYILCGTFRRDASRRHLPRVSLQRGTQSAERGNISAFPVPSSAFEGYAASRPAEFGLSSPGLRQKRFSAFPKPEGILKDVRSFYKLRPDQLSAGGPPFRIVVFVLYETANNQTPIIHFPCTYDCFRRYSVIFSKASSDTVHPSIRISPCLFDFTRK